MDFFNDLADFNAAETFVVSPNMLIHGFESRSGIIMDGVAVEHIREIAEVRNRMLVQMAVLHQMLSSS